VLIFIYLLSLIPFPTLVIFNPCVTVVPAGGSSENQRESTFPFICNIEHGKKLNPESQSIIVYYMRFSLWCLLKAVSIVKKAWCEFGGKMEINSEKNN